MKSAQQILWYASILAELFLLLHLYVSGLWRRYKFFTLCLGVDAARSLLLLNLNPASHAYFQYWRWSEPVVFAAQALTVYEAYRLSMANYRTERNEVRYLLLFALSLAVVVSCSAALFVDGEAGAWQRSYHEAFLFRRIALGVLAVCVGVTAGHCWWLRAPESPNLKVHRAILLLYFSQMTLAQLIANRLPAALIVRASVISLALDPLCFLAWAIAMRPAGESFERREFSAAERARIEAASADYEKVMRASQWRPEP